MYQFTEFCFPYFKSDGPHESGRKGCKMVLRKNIPGMIYLYPYSTFLTTSASTEHEMAV
jgi:hypothetical protein